MEKIVVKLGGSIVTYRERKAFPLTLDEITRNVNEYIREADVKRLVNEIYSANGFPLIVVNGVGPFGHFLVKYQDKLSNKKVVHESVAYLNEQIANYFKELGIKVKSCHPFEKCVYLGNRKFGKVEDLYEYGRPVLEENGIFLTYGDIVPTVEGVKGNCEPYQVISGDDLVVLLAESWGAKKIISATDVDGLFDKDPKMFKNATLIKEIRSKDRIAISKSGKEIDVTGGMGKKIRKLQIAAEKGIKCQIINGLKKDNLKKALLGDESIGTLILP